MRRPDLRRRLIGGFTPVAVLLLLLAAKFIATHVVTAAAAHRFQSASTRETTGLAAVRSTNLYERYKVFLNIGDLAYRRHDFGAAEQEFRRALALATGAPACRSRFNLVLAIEQQAKTAVTKADVAGGRARLAHAQATLSDGRECFDAARHGSDGITRRYEQERDQLAAELQQTKQSKSGKPTPGAPKAKPAPPNPADLKRIGKGQIGAKRAIQQAKDARADLPSYDGPKW